MSAKRGGVGAPPAVLEERAAQKWRAMAKAWGHVLGPADRDALRLYCDAWAEMENAQARVAEEGAMIITPRGMVQKSPWLTKVEHCREFLRKLIVQLDLRARTADASVGRSAAAFGKKAQAKLAAEQAFADDGWGALIGKLN